MKGITLNWSANGSIDSYTIYRDTSPIDVTSLPEPIATGVVDKSYVDNVDGTVDGYYYRVASIKGNKSKLSEEYFVNLHEDTQQEVNWFEPLTVSPSGSYIHGYDSQAGGYVVRPYSSPTFDTTINVLNQLDTSGGQVFFADNENVIMIDRVLLFAKSPSGLFDLRITLDGNVTNGLRKALSPDGEYILEGNSVSGTIKVYKRVTTTNYELLTEITDEPYFTNIEFSKDGSKFSYCAHGSADTVIYNFNNGSPTYFNRRSFVKNWSGDTTIYETLWVSNTVLVRVYGSTDEPHTVVETLLLDSTGFDRAASGTILAQDVQTKNVENGNVLIYAYALASYTYLKIDQDTGSIHVLEILTDNTVQNCALVPNSMNYVTGGESYSNPYGTVLVKPLPTMNLS